MINNHEINVNPILHKKFKNQDHNIIISAVIINIPKLNVCTKLIINVITAKTKYNIAGVHMFESAIFYNNTRYFIFLYTLLSHAKLFNNPKSIKN